MENYFDKAITDDSKMGPYVPFATPAISKLPCIPQIQPRGLAGNHRRDIEARKIPNGCAHQLGLRARALYRIRFILTGDICG